jgi:hypothetical protein
MFHPFMVCGLIHSVVGSEDLVVDHYSWVGQKCGEVVKHRKIAEDLKNSFYFCMVAPY